MKKEISIEVKITNRCNQQCLYCANRDGLDSGTDIDYQLFIDRLEEWHLHKEESDFSVSEIRFTGGEPLVNIDAVLKMAQACRRLGIRSGINTNGVLLSPSNIGLLEDGGIKVVKVSFDSVDGSVYSRMRGSLALPDQIAKGIERLVEKGFKVILRYTLSRLNRDQLLPCYRLAGKIGVYKFQIKPVIQVGRALHGSLGLDKQEIDSSIKELSIFYPGTGPVVEILCWPPENASELRYKFCGSIHKIYVSPKLLVTICNYVPSTEEFVIGDLAKQSFEDILRRRLEDVWIEHINGYAVVKGCPNAVCFARLSC